MDTQQTLDKVAISVSALCMLHCLLTPILIIVLPMLSHSFLADESFHKILVFFIVPLSLVAVFIGCRQHKDKAVMLLIGIGLALLTLVAFIGNDLFGEVGERLATVVCGLILISGHIRNFTLCRRAECNHSSE